MSASLLQVWLPAWRRCYRPSSVCQGKPKSFSTGLRAGSVRIRPLGEAAKAHSIPLVIAVVCLRAFATCCTVNCKLFKVLGRDAITWTRDSLFRLNFVQHLTTRKMARRWTERACCSRVARHFSPLDVDLRIYISPDGSLSSSLSSCRLAHISPSIICSWNRCRSPALDRVHTTTLETPTPHCSKHHHVGLGDILCDYHRRNFVSPVSL